MTTKTHEESAAEHGKCMLNRREFMLYSGATATAVSTTTITLFPGTTKSQ